MILTHNELVALVESGAIEGVKPEHINGASIDLTLGPTFWVESSHADGPVDLSKKQTPKMLRVDNDLMLGPGQFCLAGTEQIFHLPDNIAAHFMLKSSLARAGLNHLFAGFADPTWHSSVLTLEYHNTLRHHSLILREGMKAGQLVLFKGTSPVPPEHSYAVRGNYNNDKSSQPSRGAR